MTAMTRDQIVAYINNRLGFFEKRQAEILVELGVAQTNLEAGIHLPGKQGTIKPWFLVSEIQQATTIIDEDRVPVPGPIANVHNGFLAEVEPASLWVLDPEMDADDPWLEIVKKDFDYIQENFPGPGIPKYYAAAGVYFRLRPIPDKNYVLKIITANADLGLPAPHSTNKWSTYAPILLGATAGLAMAISLRDSVAMARFQADIDIQTLNLFTDTQAREHTNRRYVMGGED